MGAPRGRRTTIKAQLPAEHRSVCNRGFTMKSPGKSLASQPQQWAQLSGVHAKHLHCVLCRQTATGLADFPTTAGASRPCMLSVCTMCSHTGLPHKDALQLPPQKCMLALHGVARASVSQAALQSAGALHRCMPVTHVHGMSVHVKLGKGHCRAAGGVGVQIAARKAVARAEARQRLPIVLVSVCIKSNQLLGVQQAADSSRETLKEPKLIGHSLRN